MQLPIKVQPRERLEELFEECRDFTKEGDLYVAFFDGNNIKDINDKY